MGVMQKYSNILCVGWDLSHFCFVLAGFRHPSPTTVARTIRILHMLLALVGKHLNCDKFEVNTQSVAYLAGKKTTANLPLPSLGYVFTLVI